MAHTKLVAGLLAALLVSTFQQSYAADCPLLQLAQRLADPKGLTGQRQTSLVMLDRQNIAIRDVMTTYREPIGSGLPVQVAKRTTRDSFVCGDTVYAPAWASAPQSAAEAVAEADRLKRSFFAAKELAKYSK